MLKKFFLPCLAAAITFDVNAAMILSFTSSVNATTISQTPAILPIGLVSVNQSLSANDINSIKKEVAEIIKLTNSGNHKKLLHHYSKNFRSVDGKAVDYNTLVTGTGIGLGLVKSYGMQSKIHDIRVRSLGNNTSIAEMTYQVDFTKKSFLANTPEGDRLKNRSYGMSIVFEKNNGRWLVVSTENTNVNGSVSVEMNKVKTETQVSRQDQEFFTGFFNRHLDALNRKNLNDYLATLDASSPQYKKSKEETVQLFKEYTLKFTAQSVKLISRDKNEAVVEMVATVKKVSGGGFKDSKMKTTNFLKKSDGKWRIVDTSIDSVTELVAKK
jgi:ketosteroid isomerase-like protein